MPHPKREENPGASCPKVKDKELSKLIAAAWDQGWWCEPTTGGHVKCFAPLTQDAPRGKIVTVAGTPSDRRTIPNTRSALRRAGLQD